ncbi:TonB family protein [Mucilaginibacter sp.]|uniref:energy transducer TonB n=1 Tax=Mucilaginibacter sp. TaxID=1882438 RepID=UPI0028444A15|nr:TonB family protein [Mucilaginibacter sp.]MDR3695043.1 TonB family protein [Mucilaginibacter sp.]
MKFGLLFSFTLACFSVIAHPPKKTTKPLQPAGPVVMQQTLTPPEFPGGQSALFSYVMNNLKWPKNKNADSLQEVVLTFYVEKDGSLTDFKVVKSLTPSFDASVIQLLKKSPKWIPAKRGNQPIKSKYDFPIRYHSEFETNDTN